MKLFLFGCILLCANGLAQNKSVDKHIILAYSAVWLDEAFPVADYDLDRINYLARAFIELGEDGSLEIPAGFFNPYWEAIAHQHGVKLLISLGGGSAGDRNWIATASHPENLRRCLDAIGRLMLKHHYDGVDVDWEPMPQTPVKIHDYITFIKALRAKFPHAVITTALDDWVNFPSWSDITNNVNYINVMTYDYTGPWSGKAGYGTNLHLPRDYAPVPGHSVEEGMRKMIQVDHVSPSKLLMGLNFWAYRYRTDRLGASFPKNDPNFSDAITFRQVLDLLETGHYKEHWDARAAVPYLIRDGGKCVISYDNPESIRLKCEYAKQIGCAGVMIWNLGSDLCGRHAPLTDAAVKVFGGEAVTLGRSALEQALAIARRNFERASEKLGSRQIPPADTDSGSSKLDLAELEKLYGKIQRRLGSLDDQIWQRGAADN